MIRVYDADVEEPDCGRCDNQCCGEAICNNCGPEYGWAHYKRTVEENDEPIYKSFDYWKNKLYNKLHA